MALSWTAGREHTLVLQTGDHVGVASQPKLFGTVGIVNLVTGSQNHSPHVDLGVVGYIIMDDGIPPAGKDARHALRANPAGQATCGFCLSGFVIIAAFNFGEVIQALFNRNFGEGDPWLFMDFAAPHFLCDFPLGEIHHREFRGGIRFQRFSLQIADNRFCRLVPIGDCLDHKGCPRNAVSGGENTRTAGGEGVWVDRNRAFIGQAHPSIIRDEGETRSLSHGENHGITFENMIAVSNFVDRQATALIEME